MIIKNEAAFLEACLLSVKDIVSEMIILDTGSTDNSAEIARKYTDKVYAYSWIDDYSHARNQAISYASGDWILSMDADEILPERGREEILTAVMDPLVWGYILIQRNVLKDASGFAYEFIPNQNDYDEQKGFAGYVEARMVRLFRNLPEIRFEGRVHDQVAPSILRHKKPVKTLSLPIIHYGKANRQLGDLNQKQHYFKEKGALKIGESNFDPYASYEYARQCMELDLFENAYIVLTEVLKHESKWIHVPMNLAICARKLSRWKDSEKYFLMCLKLDPKYYFASTELASLHISRGNMLEAHNWLTYSLAINPKYWEAIYYLGNYHWINKNFSEAIFQYDTVLQMMPFHCRALEGLANSRFELKQYKDAENAYKRAYLIFGDDWLHNRGSFNLTDNEKIRVTYHLALSLFHQSQFKEAMNYFEIVTKKSQDHRASYFLGRCMEESRQYQEAIKIYKHLLLKEPGLKDEILARLKIIKTSLP